MIRLAVRVDRARAEAVLADLLDLAPGGVEEVDRGEVIEYAVYGPPGELPELPDLAAAAGGALVEVITEDLADDWAERWRAFHRPVLVGGRAWVRPPWEPPRPGRLDLVIDPGQAFGTGAHPTTRLCLELLLAGPGGGGPLADLGCGSGVLAVAAAKLGHAPVLAVDHDPAAVAATVANARVNGVSLQARRVDLRREPVPAAETVVANLLRPLLLEIAPRVGARRLIASGLLREEAGEVAAAYAGMREAGRLTDGEWVALDLVAAVP